MVITLETRKVEDAFYKNVIKNASWAKSDVKN